MTKEEIANLQKRCEAYRKELFKVKEELALLKGEDILLNSKIIQSENERMKAEREWINVEDRLPETNCDVLTVKKNGRVIFMSFHAPFDSGKRIFQWWGFGAWVDQHRQVTHWMPLPQSPKQSCPQCKTEYTKEELLTNEHCFKCGFEMKGF